MKQEELFEVLLKEDDITWQSMIHNLIKTEQMDPWDIDLAILSKRFIETLKKLKEMDFRISGKVILASAILLRLKSNRLVGEDMEEINKLIAFNESEDTEFFEEFGDLDTYRHGAEGGDNADERRFKLTPRTPQPRKRKVSVYDLIDALNKALDLQKGRKPRILDEIKVKMEIPKKKVDLFNETKRVYAEILEYLSKQNSNKMTFSKLVPSNEKDGKITTFSVILHLTTKRKVDIEQERHLAEIDISLVNDNENITNKS